MIIFIEYIERVKKEFFDNYVKYKRHDGREC